MASRFTTRPFGLVRLSEKTYSVRGIKVATQEKTELFVATKAVVRDMQAAVAEAGERYTRDAVSAEREAAEAARSELREMRMRLALCEQRAATAEARIADAEQRERAAAAECSRVRRAVGDVRAAISSRDAVDVRLQVATALMCA